MKILHPWKSIPMRNSQFLMRNLKLPRTCIYETSTIFDNFYTQLFVAPLGEALKLEKCVKNNKYILITLKRLAHLGKFIPAKYVDFAYLWKFIPAKYKNFAVRPNSENFFMWKFLPLKIFYIIIIPKINLSTIFQKCKNRKISQICSF